ncbi:response regulator [Natronococcus occultus]|uniref:Response regulator with CheY-like receiver domain and winged-helix DNA-binding domain n=1 Tax=Natronococcus occultus SP4 TaxID=694430 RepID=L0JX15_9EURY|nr:response regulator [Natronococcus occultus]AGB37592.1 response regulator with CheY-like receiver domain and winged-helix DNA-binding domain [Natronococcus occultus SP4]
MNDYTPDEPVDVLLIEDNPGDVRLTQEAFRATDSEISFRILRDGEEAARYFRQPEDATPCPDLVLLDLNLPRKDGFDVLEVLEEELDYPPPVLVLSSSAAEEDIAESYAADANAYLTKPDAMPEFASMAEAIEQFWIDTAKQPPAPA